MAERRRGAALEQALLEAAWEELSHSGYGALTMEAVAARAGTSRAVLYRRWPDKGALVEAVLSHVARRQAPQPPDTGSLRGDLLQAMKELSRAPAMVTAPMLLNVRSYFEATGTTPEELREKLGVEENGLVAGIYAQAERRGEVRAGELPRRLRDLPFLLLREEILQKMGPVPEEALEEILDQIVLPLVLAS